MLPVLIETDLEVCSRFQKALHEACAVPERIERAGHLRSALKTLLRGVSFHALKLPAARRKGFPQKQAAIISLMEECALYRRGLQKAPGDGLAPPNINFEGLRKRLAKLG